MPKQKRKVGLFSSVTSANTAYTFAGLHPCPSGHRSYGRNVVYARNVRRNAQLWAQHIKNKKQIFKR